jgi:hypothetical protein
MLSVLLQLVYTAWFAEPVGEPLLYDAMHACGYHPQFFPTRAALGRRFELDLQGQGK